MIDCYLTERQKEMLRGIEPGLQDGSVQANWIYQTGDDKVLVIFGLDDNEVWTNLWQDVSEADFHAFEECGFFRMGQGGRITLFAQRIINAVENNFGAKKIGSISDGAITVTPNFGPPLTGSQFQCDVFMVMPFKLIPVYEDHIKPVVEAEGLNIKLGNDFFSKHDIIREIWSAIYNSRFLIADCTDKNANVFYELGIAHMLDKPVIMLTQNKAHIPFDVQSKRYIPYENSSTGLQKLESELKTAIKKLLSEMDT